MKLLIKRLSSRLMVIIYFITLAIPFQLVAKEQLTAEPIQKDYPEYRGEYHFANSESLFPIEELMSKSNFCEISDNYMLVPNCATELFEDGTMPVDEIPISKLYPLFTEDVLEYFVWLKDDYNTPLKIKKYKESDDYKYQLYEIQQDKKCVLENTYYSISSITSDENYNLDSHTFKIGLPNALNGYDLYLTREDNHFGTYYFVTPKIDEDTAYKIETNPCNLIVFVKFTGKTRIHGVSKQAICEPIKVIIADDKTGEIYFEYSPAIDDLKDKQDKVTQSTIEQVQNIYNVEEKPKFPGGDSALIKFIQENLKYPEEAVKESIQGKVIVQFVVSKDGSLSTFSVVRGHPTLGAEAIRVLKLPTMPKWEAGKCNGEPVNVSFSMPFTFKLSD